MLVRVATTVAVALLAVSFAPAQSKPSSKAKPPEVSQPKSVRLPDAPPELADWTPRPATGKAEPWEKATDKDWVDARFLSMNTGPFFDATFRYPHGGKQETVYKGTAVRVGDGGVLFDRNTLRLAAAWSGGWLRHSDRRFGLLNTPTPVGTISFATPAEPGWAGPNGTLDSKEVGVTTPLPRGWAKYRGLHVHGDRVVFEYTVGDATVLESHRAGGSPGQPVVVRTVRVGPSATTTRDTNTGIAVAASKQPTTLVSIQGRPTADQPDDLDVLTKPGPVRWGKPIVTKLVRGKEAGPFAIDTLTVPYKNPFQALFFCTSLDHLPDGRVAVSTCHGDVWMVRVDEVQAECHWQRFATGLYHPLGVKVVDGKVVVLERGQLTRLHDDNADGEADFYECVANDWDTGAGEHSYDTGLEIDPAGHFVFFKTGDPALPTGGCLLKVSKDGSQTEVFATGFRHPIGIGMSPDGVLTGADQEGNWMPATRIDEYKKGGFYGDMRAHHRSTPPATFDPPLCWLPREVDNSAGGQVWVPPGIWGTLGGRPLHLSYGRCKAFVLLRQESATGSQGAVWDLGLGFLSGVRIGRFGADGHLYVAGLNGWQTSAQADGCLQRVRATGKPVHAPVAWEVVPDGVKLTFAEKLDPATATDPARYRVAWWGYRWSGDYGSKRYKVSDPNAVGQDDVPVTATTLLPDGKTVHIVVGGGMRPVMQVQVAMNLKAADGTPVVGSVFGTVTTVGK